MTDEQHESVERSTPRLSRRLIIGIAVAAALSIAAAVLAFIAINANSGPDFEAAVVDDCGLNLGGDARTLDSGNGLILNGAGEETSGLNITSLACVLSSLDVPDATITRMDATRALDGRQRDELEQYTIEWTYHPNDGLDVLFTK